MTITINGNLDLDEQFGVQNDGSDNDIAAASFDLIDETLKVYLAGLPAASGFPQYALRTNFVTNSDPVNDWSLVADGSGTLFSTTVGIDSGLKDLDGNTIFLFAGSDSNVVLGRVGTLADDDPSGQVAFALVLDETKAAGVVTNVDMWMIQYQALQHPIAGAVDTADTIDLSDNVFIASSFSESTTILTTSKTAFSVGFDLPGQEGGSKEIVDSRLTANGVTPEFWVQFTGDHVTGGSSAVPLTATGAAGSSTAYAAGDLFHAKPTSVSISGSANGVAGDTIQRGEVLDMDFYATSPGNNITMPPSSYANGIFLKFDGIGNSEDLIMVLKLADASAPGTILTTKAIIISASDIIKGQANVPPGFGVTLDNNDGFVVVESNDYNFANDANGAANYVIVGMQLLSSTEAITGGGLDLNSAVGANGGTTNAQVAFSAATVDTDVIKISDIGFIRSDTTTTTRNEALALGSHLIFEDDGPSLSASTPNVDALLVDETDLSGDATGDFSALFTPSYGADGAGSVGNYVLGVGADNSTGLFETASGHEVFLFLEGSDVVGREGTDSADAVAGDIVFVVSVDTAGVVKLDQRAALIHPDNPDQDETLNISGTDKITLTATATDKDGDTDTDTADITGAIAFKDDGPSGALTQDTVALVVDDDSVVGGVGSASHALATLFAAPDFGTDGPAAVDPIVYALRLDGTNVASGVVDVATGKNIVLVQEGAAINGYVDSNGDGSIGGTETLKALSFTSDGTDVTLQLFRAIEHDNPNDPNENPDDNVAPFSIETIAANKVFVDQTAYDGDGDSTVKSFDLGAVSFFLDDGPTLAGGETDITDFTGSVKQGDFGFDIGADKTGGDLDQYLTVSLTGKVGTNDITNVSVLGNATDSTPTLASYDVSFTYKPNPNDASQTANATGTLTFDGSHYTFALDAPLTGFSILTTSKTAFSQGFDAPGMSGGSKEIVDSRLTANGVTPEFWVQFTGDHATGGSSAVPLTATGAAGSATAFAAGELFHAAQTSVSISGSANGVAGDTLQRGEVLDMDFYLTSPGNNTSLAPTNYANGIFLKFDGIGNSEDLVMVLKLADASAPGTILTTKAVIISAADIIKGQANVPAGFGVTLDNNDGLAIVESNDYNFANDANGANDYVIVGMQLLSSTEAITGSGINLNSAVGANGGSPSSLVAFDSSTVDTDVIKVSDIGFIRSNSGTLPLNMDILVDVTDADGDSTDSTHLFVNPTPEQSLALLGVETFDAHYLV